MHFWLVWLTLCGPFVVSASVHRPGSPPYQDEGFGDGDMLLPHRRYRRSPQDVVFKEQVENNDPFEEFSFTDQEKKCLEQRMFLYGDKCYKLTQKGPCAENEWLVLNKDGVDGGNLKAVCKKKRCPLNEVWWAKSNKCEPLSKIPDECKRKKQVLAVDSFGDGICACSTGFGEVALQDSNKCFEYYQQGPCRPDQVVTHNAATGYAECTEDKCVSLNRGRKSREVHHYGDTSNESYLKKQQKSRKSRATVARKKYAPFDGHGACYLLNSAEVCTKVDPTQSRFVVDANVHLPRCSEPKIQLHVVDAPLLCKLDAQNQCRSQISIQEESRLSYLSGIRNHVKRKA